MEWPVGLNPAGLFFSILTSINSSKIVPLSEPRLTALSNRRFFWYNELIAKSMEQNIQQPISKIPTLKNKWKLILIIIIFLIIVGAGGYLLTKSTATAPTSTPTPISAPTPTTIPIRGVPKTSASAITSPPPSMEGINTHTELYGTGADPDIITLGPKVGGHPGWQPYQYKCGMSFEAYNRGSPVLAPFDMVLVGFRDTSTQIVSGGTSGHSDDVKLFFESASPDWPGVYLTVYHLLTSPLLTGHTQRASNDLMAPPAQGYQIFWNGNYTVSPTGNAASSGALIGYKVKRGELIGFAGTVPAPGSVGSHSFADFYFDVPDTTVNPNIQRGDIYLHLVH